MEKDYQGLHRELVLKYFWQVIKRFKTPFFTVIIATITASILDVYIPFKYLKLWNVLSVNNFNILPVARSIIVLVLILNLARWLIRRISGFCLSYFEARTMAGLREQAFACMINHSHSFFANNFSGSLVRKINKYANAFEKLADRMAADGLPLIVRGVGTVIAIYTLLPKYSIILGIFCIVFLMTAFIYIRYKLKYDILAAQADTETTGSLSDSIGNHSSVQLFTGHEYEKKRISEATQKQREATTFNWYLWEGLGAIQSFYSVAIEFIIFWVALGDWKLGLITLPVIVLLQSYLVRLMDSLWSFGSIVRAYYESFADAEEMAIILDMPYEIIDNPSYVASGIKGEVIFDEVTYVYEKNNNKVLDDFSIKIPAGQKVAIIGFSGAGKTTFARLLMRLFNLSSGRILIDGVDISLISQKDLREQIAFVPQDPVLFHRTLIENIRYGRRNATDEEVKRAASLANCDKFIDALSNGYETYVGERGIKLSGGERQRVAIARAILKNAPILVLDEATSSLDSVSESYIQNAFTELMKGKTAIVIAHRLSTVQKMDRIIVLDHGKIVEDGTHKELLEKKGFYSNLWNRQTGGFLK